MYYMTCSKNNNLYCSLVVLGFEGNWWKESLNSDGQQFHQQNNHWTQIKTTAYRCWKFMSWFYDRHNNVAVLSLLMGSHDTDISSCHLINGIPWHWQSILSSYQSGIGWHPDKGKSFRLNNLIYMINYLSKYSTNKMKNRKYHTVRIVLKYHTVRTVLKYHTVVTVLKYHTVRTVLKYHTVRIVLKSNRKTTNTTLSEQF